MGMFKRYSHGTVIPSDPNPNNFKVKACHSIGKYWISKINYPDARNFEGDKILLTSWNPLEKTTIDPHFEKDSGVLARFEPTKFGWNLAIQTAKSLVDK